MRDGRADHVLVVPKVRFVIPVYEYGYIIILYIIENTRKGGKKKGRNVVSYLPKFSATAFFWGFIIQLTRTHRTGTKFNRIPKR